MDTNPVFYLNRKLWQYSNGNHVNVVLYVFMSTVANVLMFLEPLIIAALLNVVQEQGVTAASWPLILWHLGLYVALFVGFWVFHGPSRLLENENAFLTRSNYKQYLLSGVMALPLEWHADHHSGDTISKIEKGTNGLYQYAGRTFQVIEATVRLVSSVLALLYFNVASGLISLGIMVAAIAVITRFDRVLIPQYRQLNLAENSVSAKVFDTISNITTVIILRIERLVASSIFRKIMQPLPLFNRNNRINETKWFLISVFSSTMTAVVLGIYLYSTLTTGTVVLIGTLFALYGYVGRISNVFFRFANMYGDIVQQKADVMNAELVAESFADATATARHRLPNDWRQLEIQSLNFSYHAEAGANLHVDDVSVSMRRGERIALIGASGSGKTTFLKLMRQLYPAQSGTVVVDGVVLPDGFGSMSEDIALIPQDPEIFSTSIGENITVGVPHSLQTITRFTDMACFTEAVKRLPHGLDSFIFEKGVNLSGGERQRLALARGLLACEDKSIVLLDEPTSSVDTKNELEIFRNIFKEFNDKTVIASVHRLHLLSLFDKIYFFKGGKIIASGSLEELKQTSRPFKVLWDKYQKLSQVRS